MKKYLCITLTAILALSFCSCGKEEITVEEKPKEIIEMNMGIEDDTANDGTVIVLYRTATTRENIDNEAVLRVQNAINEYIKDKIGIQIVMYDISSSKYVEALSLALNNNDVDLFWTASWQTIVGTNDIYTSKAAYDITELIQGSDLYYSMDESQWEASKYGGRNYFIPVYKDSAEGYDLAVRKEIADAHGWDLSNVSSLADIEPFLSDAKEDGLKYPLLLQRVAMFNRWYIDDFDFVTIENSSDWIAVDRETDSVTDTVITPQYREFVTLMADYAAKGYISSDDYEEKTSDTTPQTKDWAFTWWTDVPNNSEIKLRYGQDALTVPVTERYLHTDSMLGSCYCISSNCIEEEANACIKFMGLLYTDKYLADLYTYGIEGVDFTYDGDGNVVKMPDSTYSHSMWESASATVVSSPQEGPYTPDMYIEFNSNAHISCANGFRFDKTPVEAEYIACKGVFDIYGFALETGGVRPEDVDATIEEYHAALLDAGYQKILDECNYQYEEWKHSEK